MSQEGYVIGVVGLSDSSIDDVVSIINYIHFKGILKANFTNWLTKRASFDLGVNNNVYRYGTVLKRIVSELYGVNVNDFDDKEKLDRWFSLTNRFYIDYPELLGHIYWKIEGKDLLHKPIASYTDFIHTKMPIIQLKHLIDFVAKDVVTMMLGRGTLLRADNRNIIDIANSKGICIVKDIIEYGSLKSLKDDFLYGQVITVVDKESDLSQSSISVDRNTIVNDGAKSKLFYSVLGLYQKLIIKYKK